MKLPFKSKQEWADNRLLGIGASEVAEILRPHLPEEAQDQLHSSPYRIWCEKTGTVPPKDLSGFESVEWGLRHEPAIAQAVMDRTGREVVLSEEFSMYRSDDKPFLQASPDAFQKDPKKFDGPGVLQIKTAMFFKRKDWTDEKGNMSPPLPFKIQTLSEMRVTGCKWGSLVVLIGGNRLFGPFDFERNDAFLDASEPHLAAFWDRVVRRDPPPLDESDATGEVLKALYPKASGPVIDLGPECMAYVEQWQENRKIRLAAEKLEEKAKNMLKGGMKDSAIGKLPNGKLITYPAIERAGYVVEPTTYRQLGIG